MAKVDALKVPNLLHYLRALNMRHCRKILQCESQFANWPGRASRLCVQPVLTYRLGIHGWWLLPLPSTCIWSATVDTLGSPLAGLKPGQYRQLKSLMTPRNQRYPCRWPDDCGGATDITVAFSAFATLAQVWEL